MAALSPKEPATNPMTVVFCSNASYFQHLAVAAASVVLNDPGTPVDVHVLTCDRNSAAENRLRSSLARVGATSLTIHHVEDDAVGDLFIDGFLTKESYLRLLAPDLMPAHLGRVLYLDCDLVAVDSLRPLWTLDLKGKVLGAVPDHPCLPAFVSPERRALLGLPPDVPYFNSGVLLVDLARWRERNLTRELLAYARRMGSRLAFHDQDTINAVLHDDILPLDPRWNLQARMYRTGARDFPLDVAATREARHHPAVIHYTGSEKPWKFRMRTARKGDYLRYLVASGWPEEPPPLAGRAQRLELAVDRWLARHGFDYLQALHIARRVPAKLAAAGRAALRAPRPSRAQGENG